MPNRDALMTTNDILRSCRYLLNVRDTVLVEMIENAGYLATEPEIASYLKHEEEVGYEPCPDVVLAYFLNGLVLAKRGRQEGMPSPPIETPVTNNVVLKKLRVAFQLKDVDIIRLIEKSGLLKVSKTEISAFCRRPEHPNYRECGDQYLRNLLKGLTP